MVKPIPQEGQTNSSKSPHQRGEQEAAIDIRLDRHSSKCWRSQHTPRDGALGNLKTKTLSGLDIRGQIVTGHIQLLLQSLILLHLNWTDLKSAGQLFLLKSNLGDLSFVFTETGLEGVQLSPPQ
jgi:hypothetical protein